MKNEEGANKQRPEPVFSSTLRSLAQLSDRSSSGTPCKKKKKDTGS